MPVLEKAKLAILRDRGAQSRTNPEVERGTEVEVQFNPSTLRLKLKNSHDRGENEGRQVRQFIGSNSESYTMDLQFDSADEGRNGEPISVREKTEIVERFLRPRRRGAQPPRLRFMWGDFTIDGVVESLDLEFDHFAYNGVPLRAKATITLKRQDSTLEILPEDSRQAATSQAQPGDSGGGAPGGEAPGPGAGQQVAPAQGDETPAEFAARMGLDPAAWRALGFDAEAGLSLAAGAEVGFGAGIGVGVGLGVHVGFSAGIGASASIEAGFGLSLDAGVAAGASASFGVSASASLSAGFRLSASGGVEAALELSASVEASAAVSGSIAAFGASAGFAATASLGYGASVSSSTQVVSSSAYATASTFADASAGGPSASTSATRALPSGPSRPAQVRTPLANATHRPGAHLELQAAPPPPRLDKRARTFGRGVPLRKRVEVRPARPLERVEVHAPLVATRPTQAPWDALPSLDRGRISADRQQATLSPTQSCAKPCVCSDDSTRAPWSIEREEGDA